MTGWAAASTWRRVMDSKPPCLPSHLHPALLCCKLPSMCCLTSLTHLTVCCSGPVRSDTMFINSTFDDDVVIEDNRNALLMYRNPNNLVCAAAPLVEQVPPDFLAVSDSCAKCGEWRCVQSVGKGGGGRGGEE